MGLVHDHSVTALRDLALPCLRLRLLLRGCILRRLCAGHVQQPAQDERKLLQRSDHDLGAVDQRRGKLLAVLVDGLDHALGMFNLVDRILKLLIEHPPVGDDDDAVEDLSVLAIVQAGQAMRQPRDTVGLPAPRRMLDQIVVARPFAPRRGDGLPHRVELVVARKNHRLLGDAPLTALAIVDLLLSLLQEHEVPKDVEEAVALEHVFPEVARPVAGRMLRIAGAALNLAWMAAAVEGQKVGVRAAQPRRHLHLVRIGGEVDQGARLEAEERRARVAVLLVLAHCVSPVLTCAGILQLAACDRQPVHREQDVQRVVLARMTEYLPRDRELVLGVKRQDLLVEAVRRLEIRETEGLAIELEAVAQDVQRTLEVELFDQRASNQGLQPGPMQRAHRPPEVRLSRFEEVEHAGRKEGTLHIPLGVGAHLPASVEQHRFDVGLEGPLVGLSAHG